MPSHYRTSLFIVLLVTTLGITSGCTSVNTPYGNSESKLEYFKPGPGSNQMLREKVSVAPGLEVIISDVVIPPNAQVPKHYHPGEEFVYLIEGSAVHVVEGEPDRVVNAGEALVIRPNVIHSPRGGPDGGRAIVFRLHVADQPERIPVD